MENLLVILFSAILVNNFVLARFLGLCPFLGVSRELKSSLSMGAAVIFVMTLASVSTWFIQYYLLIPPDHCFHFGYRCTGTVCGNGNSKGKPRASKGIGNLSSLNHYQLCGSRCLHPQYQRGL